MTSTAAMLPLPTSQEQRAPWLVITASYLWWGVIAAQLIGLAWIGLTFASAARIGGPAWDSLFTYGPVCLVMLALTISEVPLVLRLRRGSRAARLALVYLSVPAALVLGAFLQDLWWVAQAAATSIASPGPAGAGSSPAFWALVVSAATMAIAAGVLPFIGPALPFFRRSSRSAQHSPSASDTSSGVGGTVG
jgi:hypothetical protein